MNFNRPALTNRINTLVRLALEIDSTGFASQQLCHATDHFSLAGPDLGPLAHNGDVNIANLESTLTDPPHGLLQKDTAVLPIMARIVIWKQLANIWLTNRAKQGICYGV